MHFIMRFFLALLPVVTQATVLPRQTAEYFQIQNFSDFHSNSTAAATLSFILHDDVRSIDTNCVTSTPGPGQIGNLTSYVSCTNNNAAFRLERDDEGGMNLYIQVDNANGDITCGNETIGLQCSGVSNGQNCRTMTLSEFISPDESEDGSDCP